MHPTILDLTQWRPFDLDVAAWVGRNWPFLLIALALALGAGTFAQRRAAQGRKAYYALGLAALLVGLAVMASLALAFGRVHSYGLMMALGFLVAISVARWRAARCGEDPDTITTLGILALVGGVVGARISYLIESYAKTGSAPNFFALTSGGLVFDGGLILAVVLVLAYLRFRRLPVRRMFDIITVSTMIGLAFGRAGCLLNGCCYGGLCRSDFPLALHFPYAASPLIYPHEGDNPYPPDAHSSAVYQHQFEQAYRPAGDAPPPLRLEVPPELIARTPGGYSELKRPHDLASPQELAAASHAHALGVQPAQVYGIINALVLAGLLGAFFRLRSREGQVFAMLFILYPMARFVLEIIRDDNPGMIVTPAQVKSLIMLGFGVVLLAALRLLPASAGPTLAERLASEKASAGSRAGNSRPNRKRGRG